MEIKPGASYRRSADSRPFAGIVWAGHGTINGNAFGIDESKEFLVVSGHEVLIRNDHDAETLIVYTVFPYDESIQD